MNTNYFGQPAGGYYNIPQFQQQQNSLKGRPVSSLEEVRAAQIDFDGSLFIFPDLANKKIYTKQVNPDGTAALNMYELTPIPESAPAGSNWVTKDELEKALAQLKESLGSTKEDKAMPAINF